MSKCAYCEKPKCRCNYKYSKLAKRVIAHSGTKQDSTLGEMLQKIVEEYTKLPLDMKGAWFVSFSEFDERKVYRNRGRH